MTVSSDASAPPSTVTLIASWGPSLVNFRRPLIEKLICRGHRVVAAAPSIDPTTRKTLTDLGAEVEELPLVRRSLLSGGDLAAIRRLRRLARRSRPDDVLVPYTIKPVLLTGIAQRVTRRSAALVPMFTGLGVLSRTEHTRAGAVLRVLLRWALRNARRAIVQHEADRDWLRRHRIVPIDITISIVPGSGVDVDHFAARPLVTADRPEVLYLGRMVPEKGITAFCDYAEAADFDATWVAVGPFEDESTRRELLARFDRVGIDYRGPAEDVRPHLEAARVVVLPTTYGEGVPRVIQEAMAVGRPVVVSNNPGCRFAVEDQVTGALIEPDAIDVALTAIAALCDDEAHAAAWGAAARRRAESVFEAGSVAQVTADAVLARPAHLDCSAGG